MKSPQITKKIAVHKLTELDNWHSMSSLWNKRKISFYTGSASGSDSGLARQGEFLEWCKRNSMILKVRAALDYPTFPRRPMSIPSPRGMISRDSCLQLDTTEFNGYLRDTFFEDPPAPGRTDSLSSPSRIQRIWHHLLADWGQLKETRLRNREKEWDKNRRVLQYQTLRFARNSTIWNS